jgi:CxxC motif-containing protein (DUF1111 family)
MRRNRAACASVLGRTIGTLALLAMGGNPPPQFGDPLPGLNADQLARFQAGKAAFEEEEDEADGLGPVFNDVSCVNCHFVGNTGGGSETLETRFGRLVNGVFDPLSELGGSLIQVSGIGQFGNTNFVGEVVPPQANVTARRRTTPLFGLGLVDAVPDTTFIQMALAQQQNTPSTAGQVHFVADVASGQQERVGKFGWKCQNATLATFSGDAYVNEMGVTTPMFADENCPQGNCLELADNPAPSPNDATNESLEKFTDFMTFLGPPPRGGINSSVIAGEVLFSQIGCGDCHTPTLVTGSGVSFHPYSDFLLHDMGGLGDGITQGQATGRLMRTAPLWGSRLFTRFLHDGRAFSFYDSIQAHDGQGAAAKARFNRLAPTDRNKVEAFLRSL